MQPLVVFWSISVGWTLRRVATSLNMKSRRFQSEYPFTSPTTIALFGRGGGGSGSL